MDPIKTFKTNMNAVMQPVPAGLILASYYGAAVTNLISGFGSLGLLILFIAAALLYHGFDTKKIQKVDNLVSFSIFAVTVAAIVLLLEIAGTLALPAIAGFGTFLSYLSKALVALVIGSAANMGWEAVGKKV